MSRLGDRPTADLVIIFLAAIVGFVVVVGCCGLVLAAFIAPNVDLSAVAIRIAAITNTLAGAIVGYVAGRGTNGRKGNDAG